MDGPIVRITMNRSAVRQLLRGPEVEQDLNRRARAIAAAAGEGHETDLWIGRTRARATVRAETFEARAREARDKSLTRAIDAGR